MKNWGKNIKKQILRRVHNDDTRDIFTMVRVRLKQNASKIYSKNPVRDAIIRNTMRVVSFVLITLLIYALFFAATKLHVLSLTGAKGLLLLLI